jgi:hypothetical protein
MTTAKCTCVNCERESESLNALLRKSSSMDAIEEMTRKAFKVGFRAGFIEAALSGATLAHCFHTVDIYARADALWAKGNK